MIAPTGMYKNFSDDAHRRRRRDGRAAILTRQPEVSTRLGKVGESVNTVAPRLLQFVMTGAYHLFPDTAPKDAQAAGAFRRGGNLS